MSLQKLPPELEKKAKKELNEDPETREQIINELRKLLAAESNLTCRTDDQFLIRFLRAQKFDLQAAFQLVQRYYRHQHEYANLYIDFRPSAMKIVFEDKCNAMVLPDKDQRGRPIVIFMAGRWNPDTCPLNEVYRVLALSLEVVMEDEANQINGGAIIFDVEGLTPNHAKHIMPQHMYKIITLGQEAFPLMLTGIHIVRQAPIFDAVLALLKPFLNENLKKALVLHGTDWDSLHEYITPDILPEDFMGRKPPLNNSEYYKSLLANDDKYSSINKFGYQSLQKLGPRSEDMVFGSSYKKLSDD